jgi:hypothetical protein
MSYTKGERFSPFPGEKHMNQPKSKYVIQQILDLALPPPPKACVCMKTGTVSDPIIIAWYRRFRNGWDKIKDAYDQRFYRMWTYYLLSCAGSFSARRNQLWQIVFSRKGIRGGYRSIR